MFRGALFSICLPLFACNPATIAEQTPGAELIPLHTHDLQIEPGCWVPRPTTGNDMSEQMTQFQEMNLSYNVQHVLLLNRIIQEDPTAESWDLRGFLPGGGEYQTRIEATMRGERFSQFEIDTKTYVPEGQIGAGVHTSIAYGTATPRTTTVDFGAVLIRWTDHAFEYRTLQGEMVEIDGVERPGIQLVSQLRGCDPERRVSFSNAGDEGLRCWTSYGMQSDCAFVDLWP